MADNLRGVQSLYRVIDSLKTELINNDFCNSVTVGELTELDLQKQTVFPLANITVNSVTHNSNSLTFDVTITNVDIVEISKDEPENLIYNNDNLIYIWSNQLFVINKLVSRIKASKIYETWEILNDPQSEFINKEFENMLAGVQTTLNITVPNDISTC
jgi:hypothetical protein